jgi:diguanylate cyclase (GGDEF)-like protein
MGKVGENRTDHDRLAAAAPQQPGETRVFECLLDEIHELEQFRREQLTLRKLSSYLKSALTKAEAHAAIECFGPQLWPGATGTVYLLHPTDDYLERAATWGNAVLSERSLAWQDCWAMRHLQPHCVREAGREMLCRHVTQPAAVLPSFCVPLVAQGQIIGLLHLQCLKNVSNGARIEAAADPALALAMAVAEDLSLAHANMRLRESLREQSIRDSLTGLFNRRFVDEFLVRELARAERKTRQLSMIALDIDHFKRINDSFGHGAGDTVLQKVGGILRSHVRDTDVASRMGGEEFLLLLSESPLPLAAKRAEDIRSAIHGMSVKYEDHDLGPITASFGAAAFPEHGRTAAALIRAADKALYDAKNGGRNRVVAARVPA